MSSNHAASKALAYTLAALRFRKAGYAAIDRCGPHALLSGVVSLNPTSVCSICDYFDNIEDLDVLPSVEPGDVGKLIPSEFGADGLRRAGFSLLSRY